MLVAVGAVLAQHRHVQLLLGASMKHVGGGLVLTGLLYVLVAALSYFAARTQNKFLLLVQVVLLLGLLFLQVLLGGVALGRSTTSVSFDEQLACLTIGGFSQLSEAGQAKCEEFFRSDEFAGATLVWQAYYAEAKTNGNIRTMVLNMQKENFCCGSGPPLHCSNDSRAFPSRFPSTELSRETPQRRVCASAGGGMYLSTPECDARGKCSYDRPAGVCGLNPVTTSTRGCAAYVRRALTIQVQAIGGTVLAMILFPVRDLMENSDHLGFEAWLTDCGLNSSWRSSHHCVCASSGATRTYCPPSTLSARSESTPQDDIHELSSSSPSKSAREVSASAAAAHAVTSGMLILAPRRRLVGSVARSLSASCDV